MDTLVRIVTAVLAVAATVGAVALLVRTVRRILATVRLGQPMLGRRDHPRTRWATTLRETLGHTRLLRRPVIGVAHFAVFVGFGFLFFTLLTAYGQLLGGARFVLPVIGHWIVFEWATDVIAWATLLGILVLGAVRLANLPGRRGRASRFYGSTSWQGFYVEATILVVALCILALRSLEYALADAVGSPLPRSHFPLTAWAGDLFAGASVSTLSTAVYLVAFVKIAVSLAWIVVIALQPTMGVAWHRFLVFPNIWFRRDADGRRALGPLPPIYSGGAEVDMTDPGDDDLFGVGKVEDLSWKGLLDVTTCTECGRCQDVCPAWATGKPLSPKLLVLGLRDHLWAKAPALGAGMVGTDGDGRATLAPELLAELDRPLVGDAEAGGVIDPDVLWSCTNCGACVQECPVDIEHVDHIENLRRHQVLVESEFPAEFASMFRGLQNNANPWNAPPTGRLDWTRGLDFDVPVVGADVAGLGALEYLFWVGCAGAFDDRAKRTTRAVAELLHHAGVSFAVLGQAESCSGDPARRAGNEFVYRMLAEANVEVLRQAGARRVIASCAHCFNTLRNEYRQLGLELEVLHHTQVLDQLVRDGRLRPVAPEPGSADAAAGGAPNRSVGRSITYHDPCFLGRHNQVYDPPRELLAAMPDLTLTEMPRHGDKSFCCGAGGAQMWKEERIGTRVNVERTREALATGATTIATGCPFCRTMLGDGVDAAGEAAAGVEVADVAQLLLERVRPSS